MNKNEELLNLISRLNRKITICAEALEILSDEGKWENRCCGCGTRDTLVLDSNITFSDYAAKNLKDAEEVE